jgi:hypothetical protein
LRLAAKIVERQLAEPNKERVANPLAHSPRQQAAIDLLQAVDELGSIHDLTVAAQMAARDLEDTAAVSPTVELLEVILKRVEATSAKIDAARPQPEALANV